MIQDKNALITGISGQDGAYLAKLLLSKGYTVHGIIRRSSLIKTDRIDDIFQDIHDPERRLLLYYGDMSDGSNITNVISKSKPDEIYNLAAMSHVKVSFEMPEYSGDIDGLGTLRILEAVRSLGFKDKTKIYNATTSELFGKVQETPQKETTPFYPRSPYGVAKLYSYWIAKNYRESYGMFISNGILFNHTSPMRGETFICRKTTIGVGRIVAGLSERLYVGNLNAERDFGHAKDYVIAMWKMLQYHKADDFVVATGEKISVRDFIIKAFFVAGYEISFGEEGVDEKGIIVKNLSHCVNPINPGSIVVEVDPRYFRPAEVDMLLGDASKIRDQLGWYPTYNIDAIIKEMVEHDISLALKKKKSLE